MKILPVLILAVALSGCPMTSVESSAYKTVVAAKAFLDDQKAKHPECSTATSTICSDLKQATAAKDALIDAGEVYCGGPAFESGGACQPPSKGTSGAAQAQAKLQAAISNYKQTEKDVKGAVGK